MNQEKLLSERTSIRDLREGQPVEGVYAVRERELRQKKNGDPWLRLELGDATGTVEAVSWDDAESLFASIDRGAVVEVSGTFEVSERWGSKIKLSSIRPLPEGEYEITGLAPESPFSAEELEGKLARLREGIEHPSLRALLDFVFDDEEVGSRFREAPAAKKIHEAYRRGLLEHSLSVAEAVDQVARCFPSVDREVAVVGALLHDVGKMLAYNEDPLAIDYTDLGRLLGEIPMGFRMLAEATEEIQDFPPKVALAVLHIILSHHGSLEHGSPILPATREAVLVSAVDALGAKLGSFDRVEKELPEGDEWSGFDRALSGRAYFGGRD